MGTGRGLHPPDDEPHRCGAGLSPEGGVGGSAAPSHPVGDRRPVCIGNRLDQVPQAFVLADGDGVADIDPAADGDHGVGIEAAVGTHGELAGPAVANPAHRFTQEVGGAASGVGPALAQPGHQHVAGAGGDGQQRVIAPLAGIAVVACALLGQSVGLADGGARSMVSKAHRRVPPRPARPGPATRGSPGRVDGRGPTGSCAGRYPGWMAP